MNKIFYILGLSLLIGGCTKEPTPFDGEPQARLNLEYPQDSKGYYHVDIDTTTNSNTFEIFVEATEPRDEYKYNGSAFIAAQFDCNAYYVLGDIALTLPYYNAFSSINTSPSYSSPLPVGDTTLIMSQYEGYIIPLVQESPIYLKEYNSQYDDYEPMIGNYWSKRIIGPVSKGFYNDTITIYTEVYWEVGEYSFDYPEEVTYIDSIKIIFN